jgi:predicted RNA binding protein YcfA (HicA-like mRNA interferase family)
VKLPRDFSGRDLAAALAALGSEVTRQTGSHMRLETKRADGHRVTIPDHRCIAAAVIRCVAVVNRTFHASCRAGARG